MHHQRSPERPPRGYKRVGGRLIVGPVEAAAVCRLFIQAAKSSGKGVA
jgi:hypothetical protein